MLQASFDDRDFNFLESHFDGSSSPGFPYALTKYNGVKRKAYSTKRDAFDEARLDAADYFYANRKKHPNLYMCGTRGKLLHSDKPDAGRVIEFAPFDHVLSAFKWSVPLQEMFVKYRHNFNLAIGSSWYYGKASDMVRSFDKDNGLFVDLDVSGWDYSLCPDLLRYPSKVYKALIAKTSLSKAIKQNFYRHID